jgi:hypothetical protein
MSIGDINSTLQDAVRAINALNIVLGLTFPLVTLSGSKTFDPPSIAAGAQSSTTITITGAILGRFAVASFSLDTQLIELAAYVSAADTVTVLFKNGTAGAIDLASGTLAARVFG